MTKPLYQSWTRDIVQSDGFGKKVICSSLKNLLIFPYKDHFCFTKNLNLVSFSPTIPCISQSLTFRFPQKC